MRIAVVVLSLLALVGCAARNPPPASPPKHVATESAPTPSAPVALRVDHAWVKNAPSPAEQQARRQAIETLRKQVARGESFTVAWTSLQVDGSGWHVAEGETYAYEVIPAGARDLPVGRLSAIIPGDGGLHLFRILGRQAAQ